jgi:hypothetical protein
MIITLGLATLIAGAFVAPTEADVAAVVATTAEVASDVDLAARLERVTRPFLDAPYVLSPLGEGEGRGPDTDPRLRFDAFDCTTFVETGLALALSRGLDDARQRLDLIRYDRGVVDFVTRRHFPEAEWIPALVRAGLLADITRQVGGADVVVERKRIGPDIWQRTKHPGLPPLPLTRIPDGTFALDVWPLAAAAAAPARIPDGTVLHLVRADFKNVPVRVSHQGLVLTVKGQKVLRHAADRLHHRVVDEPLDRYFARMARYGKWPVTGVHLTAIVARPGWEARLRAAGDGTAPPDGSPSGG